MEGALQTAITLVASTVLTTIVGLIIKKTVENKMDKSIADQKELNELRAEKERQERKEDVVNTFREEFKPIGEKLDNLSATVELGMKGTVTLLRESMKQTHDQFINQGFASSSDAASWHELYNTYKELGGNHFSEYVDEWKNDVDAVPRQKKTSAGKTAS